MYLSRLKILRAGAAIWLCAPLLAQPARAQAISAVPQIQHIVIVLQENRSFDNYFGTFPGANGIPAGTCMPLAIGQTGGACVAPFHDIHDANAGAPHFLYNAVKDLDDGVNSAKMDGFIANEGALGTNQGTVCNNPYIEQPWCWSVYTGVMRHDVMGYHTDAEIPNYWAYAEHFRLHDGMFAGIRSWSLASHLQMTSEWSAVCTNWNVTSTCVSQLGTFKPSPKTPYPWLSFFQLLDTSNVTWKYYTGAGSEPDCDPEDMTCAPANIVGENSTNADEVPALWNPVPQYAYIRAQGAAYLAAHVPQVDQYLLDIKNGTLPQVSWIVPTQDLSEHPPFGVTAGMNYATAVINAIMQSPTYWSNTVIFLAWDDWGGFYDHVTPPLMRTSKNGLAYGFGLRVPALTIGAYVIPGVDHATYSLDNYARFIEDIFAKSTRLVPANFGNPDARPYIADSLTSIKSITSQTIPIGDLMDAFDFNQSPLPPLVLSNTIPGGLLAICTSGFAPTCTNTTVTLQWQSLGARVTGVVYHIIRDGVEVSNCATKKLTCTDQPGSGTHQYQIYSVVNGVSSPYSATAEITEP